MLPRHPSAADEAKRPEPPPRRPKPPPLPPRRMGDASRVDVEAGVALPGMHRYARDNNDDDDASRRDNASRAAATTTEFEDVQLQQTTGSIVVPNQRQEEDKEEEPPLPGRTPGEAAAAERPPKEKQKSQKRFEGEMRQEFALWAHNMALVAACTLVILGVFGLLWTRAGGYGCKVNGEAISAKLIRFNKTVDGTLGECLPRSYEEEVLLDDSSSIRRACCDPDGRNNARRNLGGSSLIGTYSILAGLFLLLFEQNSNFGFGLWMPKDSVFYRMRLSLNGLLVGGAGILALGTYATCLAGLFCLLAGVAYHVAARRGEAGDGGRARRRAAREKSRRAALEDNLLQGAVWYRRLTTFLCCGAPPETIATAFWVGLYAVANLLTFFVTLARWIHAVREMERDLKQDSVKLSNCDRCPDPSFEPYSRWRDECELNKILVRQGPLSYWAPVAKAAGVTLNLNCALLLLPVTKNVAAFLNDKVASKYYAAQRKSALFDRICRSPLARYVPFAKNLAFHKLVAAVAGILAIVHTLCHFFNYWLAPYYTQARFAKWGWAGTTFFTGGVALVAMFLIYTSATSAVRDANFEIFFFSHHFFALYYAALLLHGPNFFWWAIVPLLLYIWERRARNVRGRKPMLVSRVEWIAPVLAVHFRPVDKNDFDKFTEGTYVLLNCPYISEYEWHPFTISSARGDLFTGGRVALDTGEKVVPVDATLSETLPSEVTAEGTSLTRNNARPPPPSHVSMELSSSKKKKTTKRYTPTRKYCPISAEDPRDPAYWLEPHETAYHDFVSVHVKVREARGGSETWTQKLKDYLEMMAPRLRENNNIYPIHFTRRDERGDIQLGRRLGPDSLRPILRVDGPHAAPAMHYRHYGTVMIIGAGIGMTPCAAIVTAMLRYRWRLNHKPEILHFYWIVSHAEVRAFEWFVSLLAELEFELFRARDAGAVNPRCYAEIHVFVTRPPQTPPEDRRLKTTTATRRDGSFRGFDKPPVFEADALFAEMLFPTTPATDMARAMLQPKSASNRFQDVWVWAGRPDWATIFAAVRNQRQHRDIGVCFCGTPAIGQDLAAMCKDHSSAEDDCIFTLHKENF